MSCGYQPDISRYQRDRVTGRLWRDRYEYIHVRSHRPSMASDVPPEPAGHPSVIPSQDVGWAKRSVPNQRWARPAAFAHPTWIFGMEKQGTTGAWKRGCHRLAPSRSPVFFRMRVLNSTWCPRLSFPSSRAICSTFSITSSRSRPWTMAKRL